MTLAALAPALEVEAARLRVSLDEVSDVEARRDIAMAEARASLAALQRARGEVSDLIRKNRSATRLPKGLTQRLREEGEALARSATTLRILASALPDADGLVAPAAEISFAAARGAIPSPLEGTVVRNFGDAGATSLFEGAEITAPAYAEIYAPWSGIIRFAGTYGSYGGVIILEPEPDTLIVLSGVGRFFREAGETVLAGEPIGSLGGPLPQDEEFLISGTVPVEALALETLYIELRRGGEPVDPAQWFAF
jgi:septal ring factor EnvC (AmiA/AmiB activator)